PLNAMLRLALAGGQGSTVWVTMLVATALPPESATESRRSRYSEQPPRTANNPASATVRMTLLNCRIGFPLRHVEHVTGERTVAGDRKTRRNGRTLACLFPHGFHFSKQEEVGIVRRQGIVGRRLDHIAGPRRTHEVR